MFLFESYTGYYKNIWNFYYDNFPHFSLVLSEMTPKPVSCAELCFTSHNLENVRNKCSEKEEDSQDDVRKDTQNVHGEDTQIDCIENTQPDIDTDMVIDTDDDDDDDDNDDDVDDDFLSSVLLL